MRAMLAPVSPVFTRPTYSSIFFGLFPADSIVEGLVIRMGIDYLQT